MKCAHIVTDANGGTSISEIDIPFINTIPGKPLIASRMYSATGGLFVRGEPCFQDWHPAPRRQLVCVLSGELEIEASDGQTRKLRAGGTMLVEDTSGRGHITRISEETVVIYVVVPDGL